ncbi:MAG: FAD-dependent oxidoreductase [Patescibacteria group bacterium]
MKLTLIEKRSETKDIITFIFEPEKKIKWTPGQYLIYSLPHENPDIRGKMRFFTISSPPFEKNPSITTKIINKASSFKKALDNLSLGQTIEAKGPDGDFVIEDLNKKYVFIAKGVGISAFIPILKQLIYEKRKINALLLYINKTKDIAFKKDLEEIAKEQSEFKLKHLKNLEDTQDYILENLKKELSKYDFYVSGASIMVAKTEAFLNNLGVKKDKQKFDYFSGYKDN